MQISHIYWSRYKCNFHGSRVPVSDNHHVCSELTLSTDYLATIFGLYFSLLRKSFFPDYFPSHQSLMDTLCSNKVLITTATILHTIVLHTYLTSTSQAKNSLPEVPLRHLNQYESIPLSQGGTHIHTHMHFIYWVLNCLFFNHKQKYPSWQISSQVCERSLRSENSTK